MDFLTALGSDASSSAIDLLGQRHLQQRNMSFQREMAKNRFQYMSEDLAKAGLNPILAMKGGLSAGSVGSAGASSASSIGKSATRELQQEQGELAKQQQDQVQKAMDKMEAEIKAINANTAFTKEKTKLTGLPANIADRAENLLDTTMNSAENVRRNTRKFSQPDQTGYIGKDDKGNKVIQHYKHAKDLRKKRKQTKRGLR